MAILSDTHVLSIHYTYTSKYTEYTLYRYLLKNLKMLKKFKLKGPRFISYLLSHSNVPTYYLYPFELYYTILGIITFLVPHLTSIAGWFFF